MQKITTILNQEELIFLGLAWSVSEINQDTDNMIILADDLKYLNHKGLLLMQRTIQNMDFIKTVNPSLKVLESLNKKFNHCLLPYEN